ncbi:MAG TPA: TetR/AcrR family transcriptional regulator [Actinophytocola sp.]|uniref:TetR/AcrR family transcriptional regulator n=1 Tax=Actinophytocola sp. TaxID=1872138 RepID=UPI002DB8513F|nr:TetR/AcrR family transcriptional regulator [Actinophytocola sp.]HEU5473103.1 TetR/AcrR family transcriptional regulator [Actinophytocola sp.]
MTAATRRERDKAETDREIRHQARVLLVEQGSEAVTLRAIARKVGITAPALYRYYTSREDLIEHIRTDICTDLAAELNDDLAELPESDVLGQVFAICRGFRRWAIAHPQEFSLVFASPAEPSAGEASTQIVVPAADPFGQVFLAVAAKVLTTTTLAAPPDDSVPAELRADLETFRANLMATIAEAGFGVPADALGVGTAYAILKFWVRLYGQIALEVFGRFPFAVAKPEPLFEALLTDIMQQVGLT